VSADYVAQVILEMMLVMRILRIGRLFQVLNHFKPMRILWLALLASSYELMVLAMVCTVATFFFSTLIYYAEGRRNLDTSKFISIPVGLWYTNTQIQRLARPAAPLAACSSESVALLTVRQRHLPNMTSRVGKFLPVTGKNRFFPRKKPSRQK